jgi:parallel beta-helix repeat protein
VSSLTFTAVTSTRSSATRASRIAVVGDMPGSAPRRIRNAVIRDNKIVNFDGPGTPGANSASAAGIVVQHAERFLVAGNTVARSLADGIHITGGSRNGRVLNNTVRETGDDMIAVVSYADKGPAVRNSAAKLAGAWDEQVEKGLVRNILISGNRVSGQYSGRGITVVGGQLVAIVRNTIENVPVAAAILVAREAVYQTFGVDTVVVEGNIVRDVQTKSPPYNVNNKFSGKRTGHGAIEVHAALFDDEAADAKLRGALAVRNVVVRNNTVERSAAAAFRAGVPFDNTLRDGAATRHAGNGLIQNLSVQGNRFDDVKDAIYLLSQQLKDNGLHCDGNQRDGGDYRSPACKAPEPRLRALALNCDADGQLQ